jgi:hypothetical protein
MRPDCIENLLNCIFMICPLIKKERRHFLLQATIDSDLADKKGIRGH